MSVSDRWHTKRPRIVDGEPVKQCREHKLYPSADHLAGDRWQVRWRDEDGKQKSANRPKKGGKTGEGNPDIYAEALDAQLRHGLNRGDYTDPDAGKRPFRDYAEEVLGNRAVDEGTRRQMRGRLAKHVYPVIGAAELRQLAKRPSRIQALIASMERAGLAANTIGVTMIYVGTVFNTAVDDGLITKNPCKASSVDVPTTDRKDIVPWTAGQVAAMRDALPDRYQAMVDCGAGVGMRRGEIFALSPDDVTWLGTEPRVTIQRQIKLVKGGMVFDLPKGRKAREVRLTPRRKIALAEHMRLHPPVEVTLPWRTLAGKPTTARLFFTDAKGRPVNGDTFRPDVWRPALEMAGVEVSRANGMHALRHYFATTLLTEGESIEAVSRWLGHADATVTLRIYLHFMPSRSNARMDQIIDAAMEPAAEDARPTSHGKGS